MIKNQTNQTLPVTVIKSRSAISMHSLVELWQYRELFALMVMRDITVRYKQALLGFAWAVIQPVTMMLVFSVIFGRLAKIPSDGLPYPVFVFSGLLAWNMFNTSVTNAATSMLGASNLISKIYFPRLIVPMSAVGVSVVDFIVAFMILLCIMFFYSIAIGWSLLLLPLVLLGIMLLATGLGLFLSSLIIKYRDFRFVIPFMMQIWMYLTPVVYPLSFVPKQYQWLAYLNPMTGYIETMRAITLQTPFNLPPLIYAIIVSLVCCALGMAYFKKTEQYFADII